MKANIFFLIAEKARIKIIAVNPLIEAYIGGRKSRGATFGIRIINKIATTTGIKIETTHIQIL